MEKFKFYVEGRYPSKDVTKFLLAHSKDSDVNRQTNTGATPLHGAALQGNRGMVLSSEDQK